MKRAVCTFLLLPFFGLAMAQSLVFGPNTTHSNDVQTLNDIGLVVNQEAISRTQLARELQAAEAMLPKGMKENIPDLHQALIERVIMEHIIKQLAERAQLAVNSEDIEQGIQSVAEQNGLSVSELYKKVAIDTGMNQTQYRDFIAQQITQNSLKEMVVGNDIRITPSQVEDQVAQIARQQGSTLHLQDLLVPVPNVPVNQRGPIINDTLGKISAALKKNNDDLSRISSEVAGSRFTDLGVVNIAQIPPRFARAVIGLKSGEILSTPVVDADGMHFLKVVSKHANNGKQSYIVPEVRLAHILIRNDRQNPNAAKRDIQRIYTALQQGADFADMARRYSQDPNSAVKGENWAG